MSANTPLPQISSYAPLEEEPTYVIVFDDFIWEVAILIRTYNELGVQWYELQSLQNDEGDTFDAAEGACKILPYLMTVGQYIDALLKGNIN